MILNIVGLACFSWLLTVAEPVIRMRVLLGIHQVTEESEIRTFIVRLLDCAMCIGFWVGLIGTLSIPQAALVAVIARIIDDRLGNVNMK